MAKQFRSFTLDRAKVSKETRSFDMVFSSEFPVTRVNDDGEEFDEILSHDPDDVDLSRLKDGAPLLEMHDLNRQRGVIEGAEIDTDKRVGRATGRFSKSEEADKVFQDVLDGIRKHVSVGYELTAVKGSSKGTSGRAQVRFKWQPYEISIVSAPEDPNTGIGRGVLGPQSTVQSPAGVDGVRGATVANMRLNLDPLPAAGGGGASPSSPTAAAAPAAGAPTPGLEVRESDVLERERKRAKNINLAVTRLSEHFPAGAAQFRSIADTALADGSTAEAANEKLMAAIPGVKKQNPITMRSLGLSEQEQGEYSVGRALRSLLVNKGRVDGLEGEVHDAMCAEKIGIDPEGVWVPHDAMIRVRSRNLRMGRRDLQVGVFAQGGALVPTVLQVPIIEILRNRLVCERLGVQSLTGLVGNVAIPRQTGAATAYAVPESAALTKSTQALDQIALTPHRVGAWNDYTRQLLLQSSIDVENFIRDDIMKVLAVKWDYMILQGAGANDEPLGIFNTPGIGSVLFGGTTTWSKVLAFESALSLANADEGNMAFVTDGAVRAAWKAIAKIGSTFPIFIWEGRMGDGSNDGIVNGYRAAVTNQVLNHGVAFGNWEDCIGPAMWGGYDFIVNPYTLDTQGEVRVTCNTYGDVAVRHAQSFCWSADAGNQ